MSGPCEMVAKARLTVHSSYDEFHASNQGSKVARPSHVEICDKQRPFGEGYGVRSQKAHQNPQVHHNTSAGLSQAPSGSKEGLGNSLQVVGEVPSCPSSLPDTNHAFKPFVSTSPVFHLQFDNLILVCVQNFCNFFSSNLGKLFRAHYVQKINISSANLDLNPRVSAYHLAGQYHTVYEQHRASIFP